MLKLPVMPGLNYGRAILVRLALVCVLLRALIPPGFMADLPAAANGQFKVVICSAYGAKTIDLDLGLTPAHEQDRKASHEADCPFGMSPVAAPLPEPLAITLRLEPILSAMLTHTELARIPYSTGPPVGSRAPPLTHPIA